MTNRRFLLSVLSPLALLAVFIFAYNLVHRSRTLQTLTVNYTHSHGAAIYDASESQTGKATLVQDLSKSGASIRLKRTHTYLVTAKGDDGYEDSSRGFVLGDKPFTINLNPYYSPQKLGSLLNQERPDILRALKEKYPKIKLYTVDSGKLYHWGDWYGTILRYKGAYSQSSDSLRVVLAKEGGVWKIKTSPYITLSKYSYPSIPVDILRDVNNSFQADRFENAIKNVGGTRLR